MIRERDWTGHPLGPPETWADDFRVALGLVLNSPESMILCWGPDLHFFFNDAYFPLLGPRLPWAMGARFDEVWADALDQAMPIIDEAMAGRPQRFVDLPWNLDTDRGVADTWWTFSYSRVLNGQGAIAGLFILTTETTKAYLDGLAIKATQGRKEFLLALEGRIRELNDPREIVDAAIGALGRQIGLDRVEFTERVSERDVEIVQTWAKDPSSQPVPDASHVLAQIPVVRGDALRAELRLITVDPRDWGTADDALAREVADRMWSSVERARGDAALRRLNATLAAQVAEQSRERESLWRTSRDAFLVSDLEGRWLRVSPAWTRILGWDESDLIGRTSEWMEHPDDRLRTREEVDELAAGEVTQNFVNRFRTRSGDYRWLSWSAVADDDRLYCIARDITMERELTEERGRLEEQLRQSQKLEAIGQLTGGVAHDFNNLLTVITGSVELLRRPGLTEERRRRYVDAIGDTAGRAARLTNQLLAFARRQSLRPELFDVNRSLQDVGDMVRSLIGAGVQLQVATPDEPVLAIADRSQFDTAIVNMAINARDAMAGQGRLTISAGSAPHIPPSRTQSKVEGEFVAVTVADIGHGIAPEHLDAIFEPFFTTKEVGSGTGLGLSQVFGFARQSGGDVRVASRPGEGSIFTLYLPRAAAGTEVRESAIAPTRPVHGGGHAVLLVEDNPEVAEFAVSALNDLGYRCLPASNAEEALTILSSGVRVDAVFSDVVMPGVSGLELGEMIQAAYPNLPVVLTSGYSHVLCQNAGHGFELLHKPYSIDELSRVLRKAVGRRAADAR